MDLPDGNWQLPTHVLVYNPDKEKIIKCYVNADFADGWAQLDANDAENVMLHMGSALTYAGCQVLWCIKLHT